MREYKDGKVVLMIPTYKLRDNAKKLFAYMPQFNENYDLFIVSQVNDPAYELVKSFENERIKVLCPDVHSIFEKRYYMLEYAKKNKYKYLILIDDDIRPDIKYIEDGKYTDSGSFKVFTGKDKLNVLCDELYKWIKIDNAGMVGTYPFGTLGFYDKNKFTPAKYCTLGGMYIMDVEKADMANIKYDISGKLNEDSDINFRFLLEGYYVERIKHMTWYLADVNWYAPKSSVIYTNKKDLWHLVFGTNYKWHLDVSLNKSKTELSGIEFDGKQYFGTYNLPYLDPVILDFYKNEDYDGLFAYKLAQELKKDMEHKNQQINKIKNKIKKCQKRKEL